MAVILKSPFKTILNVLNITRTCNKHLTAFYMFLKDLIWIVFASDYTYWWNFDWLATILKMEVILNFSEWTHSLDWLPYHAYIDLQLREMSCFYHQTHTFLKKYAQISSLKWSMTVVQMTSTQIMKNISDRNKINYRFGTD